MEPEIISTRRIPEDSPEAHCLNDLDHRVWKIIAERGRGGKGVPEWIYFGLLGTVDRQVLHDQLRKGYVFTITGTYGERSLLFAKFPKLT